MMQFSFTLGDVREKQMSTSSGTLDYDEELRIEFSTGQIQVRCKNSDIDQSF